MLKQFEPLATNYKENVMTKDTKRKPPVTVMPDSRTDEETTRERAYEIYLEARDGRRT